MTTKDFWEGDLHYTALSEKTYYAVQHRTEEQICWIGSVKKIKEYGRPAVWAAISPLGREIGTYSDRTRAAQALTHPNRNI